ncbi:aminotransferase-like domain-containing protein [Lacticaseibacillus songhuajiangensis]|uniref:aminotransferase-like domain-containing protein n=1 Tax=Lacticaseibacillus songhuajiangensis TaxID=1296539 RepID=UPI000F783653|nr:PLP-dependent aminotransferase family protein [Lacticaseibacillus songhuajiangensis]
MSINSFDSYPLTWRPDRRQLPRPVYVALTKQLRRDIATGVLLPGTKLPPQRELADFLELNLSTVSKAYKLSEEQGLTYGVVGKGTFVAQNATKSNIIAKTSSTGIIDLGLVSAFDSCNKMMLPVIRDVAAQKNLVELLNYDDPTGMATHKQAGAFYLRQFGFNNITLRNLAIVSGGQNAVTVTLLGMFQPGARIAVDFFTYANFIEIAKMARVKLVPISGDREGMRADELAAACRSQELAGIYLMPEGNNPTGVRISGKRRAELAAIIEREQLILIEDDYQGFLKLGLTPVLPKISALVPDRSVYICSMTKPLAVGLRIAYLLFAEPFRAQLMGALMNVNMKTSAIDSEFVAQAVISGTAQHIIQSKIRLAEQSNALFDRILPGMAPVADARQLFRWLPLASQTESGREFEQRGLRAGVRFYHSDRFLVGPASKQKFIRVSLSSVRSLGELEEGLLRLKELLQQA